MSKKKEKLEFRYYDIPHGERVLALYGDDWVRPYGYDEQNQLITSLHFHNLLEIGICIYGKGEVILENTSHEYCSGSVTVIPKNYPHTTNAADGKKNKWEYLFLDVEKNLQEMCTDNQRLAERLAYRINRTACICNEKNHPQLAGIIKQILREMKDQNELYRESIRGLLWSLMIEMARLNPELIQENHSRTDENRKKTDLTQIARALEYVGDNYEREIRISELADACHMSETHFRRLFLHCTGMHPVDYVNQIRVKTACDMLKKTNLSITEISIKCGFGSSASFNRNFMKYIGMSPNKWKHLPENYERRLNQSEVTYHEGW